MKGRPFDNVNDQIGYCGIWCGSCMAGNGAIIELTRKYEEIFVGSGLEKWVPKDFDLKEFIKGLSSIQRTPLCPGCKKNGGYEICEIRDCASIRGLEDCSLCGELSKCGKYEFLEKSNPNIKKKLMKMVGKSRAVIIENWLGELKEKWPHCILFCRAS